MKCDDKLKSALAARYEHRPQQSDDIPRRKEATYLRIIGGLLKLLTGETNGRPNCSLFRNQEAVVQGLLELYGDRDGISERNLDKYFSNANKRLDQD